VFAVVSSQGHPHAVFRRALQRGDLPAVRAAAAELPAVALGDALEIVCLILAQEPERFERAAVRWLARLLAERPQPQTSGRVPTAESDARSSS
jgi:hypothetical protein